MSPPTTSASVLAWFEAAVSVPLPQHDGTLATARDAAKAYARRAKAANTRRAYIASARAWYGWCARHGRTPLPASGADVAAFLSDKALQGRSMATIGLRRSASVTCKCLMAGPSQPAISRCQKR